MDIILLLINKTLMMLLLSGIGFILCRRGKITIEGNLCFAIYSYLRLYPACCSGVF